MADKRQALRDWHRLFGLLLNDFFTGSPFIVEIERDLSVQQQMLDVVIVRRGRGRFAGRLPDGLEGLLAHNLITFKSHRETLDSSRLGSARVNERTFAVFQPNVDINTPVPSRQADVASSMEIPPFARRSP
jgi:hypothetical protein